MRPDLATNQRPLKKSYLTLLLVLMSSLAAMSQTVDCSINSNCNDAFCNFAANVERGCHCFNNIDDDGDGKIDKADPNCATYYGLTFIGEGSDCNLPIPNTGLFTGMSFSGASSQNTADTQAKVTVGDVDGDGAPDAVITSKFARKLSVVATWGTQADGSKVGDAKATVDATNVSWFNHGTGACDPAQTKPTFEHELAIADIDPTATDKRAEIFAIVGLRPNSANNPVPNCYYLVGMRYNAGNGNITLLPGWNGKAASIGVNRPGAHGVADMDGDGKAEIYLRDRIYAAETGALLATGNGDWDLDVTSGPVAADIIKGDNGKMELVVGTFIYSIPNLSNRNPGTPATMTPTKKMNDLLAPADQCFVKLATDPTEYGVDTHSMCSIADIDRDGNIDVIISGALGSVTGKTTVFYWNVALNTVTRYIAPDPFYANGWPWGTGRVNIGDADGDGSPNLSFVAGNQLTCLKIDAGGVLTPMWIRTINDSKSGVVTVTIYDFDSDGNPELVYRDAQELVVVDGDTGATKLWSATCQSHTYTEGPIIADVNGDGLTDICVTCNTSNSFDINAPLQQQALGQIRLWNNSGGTTWAPTRKIWNQQPYFVVNINDDMTLPFPMVDQNIVFSGGSCLTGITGPLMRMNVFLNQIPFLTSSGCPIMPAPDLTFSPVTLPDNSILPAVEVIPPVCGDRNIQVRFNIKNVGDLPITDNIPISFFNGDPTVAGATLLHSTSIAVTGLQIDATFTSPYITFNGPGPTFQLYVVLNNNGSVLPINPAGTVTNECRIDNNIYPITVTPTPFTAQVVKIKDNFTCNNTPPNNGELAVKIFKGATEVTDFSQYTFQWNTGPTTGFTPIAGATNYNLTALDEGTYTVVVTNTLGQCSAVPVQGTIIETGNDPAVTITVVSHQTQCNPENGKLVASIAGGDLGYTYEWFDIALTPLGITGNTADGLAAGNYLVRVSKDGCSKLSLPVTVEPPAIPDAQATTLRDVVNCNFLSDGKVTARAVINGVPIPDADTTLYKFQWFFYNNATATQGSIIPVGTETNPSRAGLTAGFYMVEVTNIATQCKSNMKPFTEVKNSTVLPTAQITKLIPQTSCDPNNPNASLAGDALVAGVVQDPALYTFEWFRGQNTLAGNLHTTTSGTNGRVAVNVKGGGLSYTVRVTNIANSCSATTDLPADELLIEPVITVTTDPNGICDPALAGTAFTGRVISSVTFNGVAVTDFTNYKFDWHDGSLVTDPAIPVADVKNPILGGLDDGSYTVTVTRTDLFCTSDPQTGVVVDAITLPVITSNAVPSTNCDPLLANGKALVTDVDGTGTGVPYTFQWHTGLTATAPIAGATTASLLNRQGGPGQNFTVLVTKTTTGCQNTATIQVPDASALPTLSLAPTPNGICDPTLTSPAATFSGSVVATITNQVGVVGDYTFTWRNGQLVTDQVNNTSTTGTIATLNGGFYTTTVKHNPTGCVSDPFTAQVINNTVLPAITSNAIPSTSCDPALANGQAQVTDVDGAGTGAPFIFQWHTGVGTSSPIVGATAAILANRQGGVGQNFTVRVVKQTTGCVNTATILIPDARVLPTLALTPVANGICNPALTSPAVNFAGSVTAAITNQIGAAGDYVFTWRDGQLVTSPINNTSTTNAIVNLNSGFYTTTVKHNPTGCVSDPFTAQVVNTTVLPVLATNAVPSTNCDPALANGQAQITDVDGVGTGAPYIFQWHTGVDTSTPIASATNPVLLNKQGGPGQNFTVLVTKQTTGCQSTATILIPDASVLPTLSLAPVANGICDPALTSPATNFNGSVTATITNMIGVVADYAFTWRNGQLVTDPPNNTSTTGSLTNLNSGFYTTTVKHAPTGCVSDPSTAQVLDITILPAITTNAVPSTNCDPALANGQALVTDVDGVGTGAPYIFQWHTGIDTSSPLAGATNAVLLNRQGGAGQNFTVLVTKQTTGCQQTNTVMVPDAKVLPTLSLVAAPNTICDPALTSPSVQFNGNVSATITNQIGLIGDYVFTWHNGQLITDAVNPTSTTGALINLNSGFYTTTVKHTPTGCVSDPFSSQVPDNTAIPVITTDAVPSTNCDPALANGQAIVTDVDGAGTGAPFIFQWHTGIDTSTPIATATGAILANRQGGAGQNFTALVTRQTTGCQSTATVLVPDAKELPIVTLTATPNTICNGTPDGAAALATLTYQGNPVASPYTGYTFLWSTTATTPAIGSLAQNTYSLAVTRTDVGCTSDVVFVDVIDNFFIPPIDVALINQTSCNVLTPNGILTATVDETGIGGLAGVNSGYTFNWFNGTGTSGLAVTTTTAVNGQVNTLPGNLNYTVEVRRAVTNCTNTETVFLPEVITYPIVVAAVSSDVSRCDLPDGSIQANVGGAEVGYTFFWLNEDDQNQTTDANVVMTNADATIVDDGNYPNLIPGYYTVAVRDNFTSCVSQPVTEEVDDVSIKSVISITLGPVLPSTCGVADGQMSATVSGGVGPFNLFWHNGGPNNSDIDFFTNPPQFTPPNDVPFSSALGTTNSSISNLESKLYTLIVKDQGNGCGNYETVFLPFTDSHDIDETLTPSNICPYTIGNGEIEVSVINIPAVPAGLTFGNFSYALYSGENPLAANQIGARIGPGAPPVTNPMVYSSLARGKYTIEVKQEFSGGCPVYKVVEIESQALPPVISLVGALTANTACDLTSADGAATINISKDPNDMTIGSTYTLGVSPAPTAPPAYPIAGLGVGNRNIVNLRPSSDVPVYTVTVTSSNNCVAQRFLSIPDQPQVSEMVDGNITITDAMLCTPSGSVVVNSIDVINGVGDPDFTTLSNYTFNWYNNASLTGPAIHTGVGLTPNGETLNITTFPAIGPGSYWVESIKTGGTKGIGCTSAPFKADIEDVSEDPTFTLAPFSNTACDANFEGSLMLSVTDAGSAATATYTYDWDAANPFDIEAGGGPVIANNDGSGADDNPSSLPNGVYKVTVTNVASGCSTAGQATILKTETPILVALATPVNQIICNPDGSITVNEVQVDGIADPNHANFDFTWFVGSTASAPVINAVNDADVLNVSNLPTIGAGTYFVKAKRIAGVAPGSGCESAPLRVEILDDSKDPLFTITPFDNTACDTNFEGSLLVNVTDPGSVPSATYTYTWDATNPVPLGIVSANDDGVGPDDNPINLGDGTYKLTVKNDASGCITPGQATIVKTATPIVVALATPVDQMICNPDGSITVNEVRVDGIADVNHANFDFTWYVGSSTSVPVINAVNNVDVLNIANLPTIGAGSYFVKAKRVAGVSIGSGCESAPLKVDIQDLSKNPLFTLSPFSNTACDANFEGSLLLDVTDPGSVPSATYTYTWDPSNPVAFGTVAGNDDGAGADENPTALPDGTYKLTVKNDASGCITPGQATILKSETPIVVALATPIDQLICNPDGSITVNEVRVDGIADANHANFNFTWFVGSASSVPVINEVNDADVLDISNLPTIGAGTYFVKAKRVAGVSIGSGCESAPLRVDIQDVSRNPIFSLTPFSNTACDINFEGSLLLDVTDAGSVPSVSYTYTWDAANPVPFGTVVGNDDGAGADENPTALPDGTYKLTVKNDASGCITPGQATILKTETPIVVALATPIDQLICKPDGSITVNEVRVDGIADANHANFDFTWFVGSTANAPVINEVNNVDVLNTLNLPTIGEGTYFVKAKRVAGVTIGSGCESAPLRVDIQDVSRNPIFSLTPFSNTACDANFEGSLLLDVTDPGSVPSATYTYTWNAANPVAFGTVVGNDDGLGVDENPTGLPDGTYALTVTNDVSGCITPGQATIKKLETPILVALATPIDQMICNPDGSITVNEVRVDGIADPNHSNFDFTWYVGSPANAPVINEINNADVLNVTNLPTIGAGTYFVKAKRAVGVGFGSGCESAPLRVDIQDLSVDPDMSFVSVPNSSCNNLNPNAQITATAVERDGTTDTYSFSWLINGNPLALPTTQTDLTPTSQLAQAFDGSYSLEVHNTLTGCRFTKSIVIELDQTMSFPNILDTDEVDPVNCFPTGSSEVVSVSIGGQPPIAGNDPRFAYDWFEAGNFPTTPIAGQNGSTLPNQLPGDYFVIVRDVTTDCPSAPTEVVIDDAVIVYPDIDIVQTMKQLMCDGTGSAVLQASADGGNTGGTYSFTWFGTLDGTGSPLPGGNTATLSNLTQGNYSVTVFNSATNCEATDLYIIEDESPDYYPQIVLTGYARKNCVIADGGLFAQEVAFETFTDYPFASNYTAHRYDGAKETVDVLTPGGGTLLTSVPGFPRHWDVTGLTENLFYTIKIVDNNTQCIVFEDIQIESGMVDPVVDLMIDNPLINCDVAQPNGQIAATADGGLIGGYTFEWFTGNSTAGTPLPGNTNGNKLVGVGAVQSPTLEFTVRVTNDITQCDTEATAQLVDGRLPAPTPTPELIQHDTRCDSDDGWVTASVDGQVAGYIFTWNDGTPQVDPNLQNLAAGTYNVIAIDGVTGCESIAVPVIVEDLSVIPDLIFKTTASFCKDVFLNQGQDGTKGTGTIELQFDPADLVSDDVTWTSLETGAQVGTGNYIAELLPGEYRADVITSKGCPTKGITKIESEILSYNLVTRNNDGKNDNFYIDCMSLFPKNNVKIFNRSGVLVYEANGYNNDDVVFDGFGKTGIYAAGNDLPVGTYFYIIDKGDGSKPRTGYLELVK
jgi:hypothetical protein